VLRRMGAIEVLNDTREQTSHSVTSGDPTQHFISIGQWVTRQGEYVASEWQLASVPTIRTQYS